MPLLKPYQFPTRSLPAQVLCVVHANCLEVRLGLEFGLSVVKRVVIEGIDRHTIVPRLRQQAKKAMVILVGGKSVVVHTDPFAQDDRIRGRVYLNERVYDPPAEVMWEPHGLSCDMLEVGGFFTWLQESDFDLAALKRVLNGRRNKAVT